MRLPKTNRLAVKERSNLGSSSPIDFEKERAGVRLQLDHLGDGCEIEQRGPTMEAFKSAKTKERDVLKESRIARQRHACGCHSMEKKRQGGGLQ